MNTSDLLARAREAFSRTAASEALRRKAEAGLERWLTDDMFRDARPQIEHLVDTDAFSALFDAFFQDIPFGTGGRRGPVGFGTNRINLHTIATSIEGHSRFLRERFPALQDISVVVAYDVRVFNDIRGVYSREKPNPLLGATSRDFARLAAEVYAANGIRVWMPDPIEGHYVSTPELSFSIRHLGAQGGLNVSASHNHPDDNGAKIYSDKGSQEVPPVDEALAKIVEATAAARRIPFEEAVRKKLVRWLASEVHEAYVDMNARVSRDPAARSARVVFTPLHGTGLNSVGAALLQAGFQLDPFPDQAKPDGTFANVPFRSPNPEVRESLLGAKEYALSRSANLVLGTDPDADRIGMMCPHEGEWVFLDGNRIGVVLAHYLLMDPAGRKLRSGAKGLAITTVVTTSLFGRIARAAGADVIDDLGVGFKYIADILNTLEAKGRCRDITARLEDFVIGIEESHGYLVVPHVRDKDAAGAGVLLAEIASRLKDRGTSFLDYLDAIYREFGYVRNLLVNTVMQGAQGFLNIRKIQDSLRARPPASIGGRNVAEVIDRWREDGPFGKILSETDRMSRDLLTFRLDGDARIIIRPSGTESKNKVYVEVSGSPLGKGASAADLAAEKRRIDEAAKLLGRAFTREMLSRIEVDLPDHALEVSDLVSLENKRDFAEKLLPELVRRLEKGERGTALESWVDGRLKPYGADGRLLVAGAVAAYAAGAGVAPPVAEWLREAFSRKE
jgi:phosphoglucomutase/phosphomannomutase